MRMNSHFSILKVINIFSGIHSNNKLTLIPYLFIACKGTAKLMYTGTLALGCKAYQDAQKSACKCTIKDEL